MKYEKPEMKITEVEAVDVLTESENWLINNSSNLNIEDSYNSTGEEW